MPANAGPRTVRAVVGIACALLIALILLNLAWELVLAPVKPGGSISAR